MDYKKWGETYQAYWDELGTTQEGRQLQQAILRERQLASEPVGRRLTRGVTLTA